MRTKNGSELQVGDSIKTWFGWQRITRLDAYVGPLANLWNGEARIAALTPSRLGMTIEPNEVFEIE